MGLMNLSVWGRDSPRGLDTAMVLAMRERDCDMEGAWSGPSVVSATGTSGYLTTLHYATLSERKANFGPMKSWLLCYLG